MATRDEERRAKTQQFHLASSHQRRRTVHTAAEGNYIVSFLIDEHYERYEMKDHRLLTNEAEGNVTS